MVGLGRTIQTLFLIFAYAAWRRRYLIVIPLLAMPVAGVMSGLTAPDRFSASMTLLVQEPAAINPFLEDLTISTDLKDRMDALVAQMGTATALRAIAEVAGWIGPQMDETEQLARVEALGRDMRIRLIGKEVVEISFSSPQAQGIAAVVEAIGARFTQDLLAPAQSSVMASEAFLSEERARFERELAAAETELGAFKAANAESLPALHARNVEALATTRARLGELRADLAGKEAQLGRNQRRLAETDPIIGRIDARIGEVEAQLAGLLVRYTENHSQVRRARAEVAALSERREALRQGVLAGPGRGWEGEDGTERLWNMLSEATPETRSLLQDQLGALQDAKAEIDRMESQIASLEDREAALDLRVRAFAEVERQIAALEREVEVKRELLSRLSERYEMARVTGALGREATPDLVRVVDAPYDPLASDTLPLAVYLLAGIAGGLALGAGLAFGAEMLDTTITRPAMVADLTGVPLLARLEPGAALTLQIGAAARGEVGHAPA